MTKDTCQVDSHPLREDIDDLLRAGKSYGDVRAYLIDHNEKPLERYTLSRHSLKHLNLDRRGPGRKAVATSEDVPEVGKVRDLAISILYARLQSQPASVRTQDLIPFLVQAMKATAPKGDDTDAILAELSNANNRVEPQG